MAAGAAEGAPLLCSFERACAIAAAGPMQDGECRAGDGLLRVLATFPGTPGGAAAVTMIPPTGRPPVSGAGTGFGDGPHKAMQAVLKVEGEPALVSLTLDGGGALLSVISDGLAISYAGACAPAEDTK